VQPSPVTSAHTISTLPGTPRHRLLAALLCAIAAGALAAPGAASARPRAASLAEGSESAQAPVEPAPEEAEAGEGEAVPAEPPPAPTRRKGRGCRVSLESSSSLVTAGDAVTLSAQLVCATAGSDLAAPISIYQRRHGAGATARALVTASTAQDGSYELTISAVAANSTFIARSPGAGSAHTVVKVLPLVTLAGPAGTQIATRSTARTRTRARARDDRVRFTGTISPVAAGTQVSLQSQNGAGGEQWRTIALTRVDGTGHYAFLHSFRIPGEVSLRAVTHPKGATLGASQPLTYAITQAQNPVLTIHVSLDPIVFGQSVTISGVAAGAAPQQVTLLARTAGHPFAAIATAGTGEGGGYSFTTTPQQSTAYEVSTATATSTVLFEGLKFRLTQDIAPTTVEALTPLTLSGTLVPSPAGQLVQLEQQNGSGRGFHVVAVGTVDSVAHYTLAYTFSKPAAYVLRIKVPAGPSSQTSLGPPFTVTVTPAAASVSTEEGEEEAGSEPEEATRPVA
jgi:hypothetical protein